MKTKEKKELHGKKVEELRLQVRTLKEELFLLQLEYNRRKLKNTSSILHKRKNIAKVKTILQEKENIVV